MPDRSSNRRFPVDAGEVSPRLALALLFALLPVHLAALPTPSERPPRGYQPRDCGFDMNDNGIVGEAEDCRVCDGTTTDPDGDGDDEDLYYVDCQNGTDDSTCGTPGSPCGTIEYAWGTRANGPMVGAEDIICFRGTCTPPESFTPPFGGVTTPPGDGIADFYVVPATGSQGRDWRYPKNPTMLVGWDSDGDHVYPPKDLNDLAVLTGVTRRRAFRLDKGTSHLEMAHFTARGYGRAFQDNDTGFLRWGPNFDTIAYQHFHDLALLSINQDRDTTSGNGLVNLFASTAIPRWILFENLEVLDNGQWFVRGSGHDDKLDGEPDMGPFRFTNITRTAHSCSFADCGSGAGSTVFKMWSYLTGVEILDSIWDANVVEDDEEEDGWVPKAVGGPSGSNFINPAECTQDWLVRNNEVIDYKNPVTIEGYSPNFCDGSPGKQPARPVDNIVIDGNYFWNTFEPWDSGDVGVRIQNVGFARGSHIGRVQITNNVFGSLPGWEAAVWIRAGNSVEPAPASAKITVAHNTFYGDINRHGALVIGDVEGTDGVFPLDDIEVHHNVFDGLVPNGENDFAVLSTYAPAGFVSRFNTFDPRGRYLWAGAAPAGFLYWETIDAGGSRSCSPAFVGATAGDLHLSTDDTCARDRGSAPEPGVILDFDGGPRVELGALDIGADEVSASIFADDFESGDAMAWSLFSP